MHRGRQNGAARSTLGHAVHSPQEHEGLGPGLAERSSIMTARLPSSRQAVPSSRQARSRSGVTRLRQQPPPPRSPQDSQEVTHLDLARALVLGQADALTRTASLMDERFMAAVAEIRACDGRVVTCGMGKSGLIAQKIAATMSSMGTPAFFLHPSEARHGDLGMVTQEDVLLMVSCSGETDELIALLPALRAMGVRRIAIVGSMDSTLARSCEIALDASVEREACPLNLAPTTSSLVALSIGDALAVILSHSQGYAADDFVRIHPAGTRGRQLRTRVRDVMRRSDLPLVHPEQPLAEVILEMTAGRCGIAIVNDTSGRLVGIITDGDLRRHFCSSATHANLRAQDVMTPNPLVIAENALIRDAEELMQAKRVKVLLAVDEAGAVRGLVDVFVNR